MSREAELQRLVINAIRALDAIVIWRDDNLELEVSDKVYMALGKVEEVDSLLSNIVEELS